MNELALIGRILTYSGLTMTVTPTHPDLDVDAFHVDLKCPRDVVFTGRAVNLDRAIALALQQWRTGHGGVRDEAASRSSTTCRSPHERFRRALQAPGGRYAHQRRAQRRDRPGPVPGGLLIEGVYKELTGR